MGELIDIALGVIFLIGLGALVLWLIGLPADDDEEEPASLIAGNWDRIERWTGDHHD